MTDQSRGATPRPTIPSYEEIAEQTFGTLWQTEGT